MKMKKLTITLSAMVFSLGLVVQANAQGPSIDTDPPPSQDAGAGSSFVIPNATQQAVTAGTYVLGRNFIIPPGRYVDFKLPTTYSLDWSSHVAISILAPNYALAGTFIVPYFAAPGAFYTAVDLIDCSQFNYFTQGGALVPVYGTYMVVRLYNLSGGPVTYAQLMAHWSGH
jgi:hypothetical protein